MHARSEAHEKAQAHMRKNTRSECTRKSKHTKERAGEEQKEKDDIGRERGCVRVSKRE